MRASRVLAVVLRQYYLIRGSLARLLPMVVWVAVDILLWGFLSRYLGEVTGGARFVSTLLGAVLMWDFFSRVMHGVSTAFLEDVWSRNFLNLFASPLTIGEYLLGLVITSLGTSMVGLVVMVVLAMSVFGLSYGVYGLAMAPFVLTLLLFGVALGIFGSGLVLRLGPASEWLVWPIPAVMSPFAAVFYPLATLPVWMRGVARVLPPSYVFEGMRGIVNGEGFSPGMLTIGLGLTVVHLVLACWFFTWTYRGAVRSGLIARYSAESVG
jgi:ABC-2 type transport system permease protein